MHSIIDGISVTKSTKFPYDFKLVRIWTKEEWSQEYLMRIHRLPDIEKENHPTGQGIILPDDLSEEEVRLYIKELLISDNIETLYCYAYTLDSFDLYSLAEYKERKRNGLKHDIRIKAVFEGNFYNLVHKQELQEVDLPTYKPKEEEDFELLFQLEVYFEDGTFEDFFLTETTRKTVKRTYQKIFAANPNERLCYSYKFGTYEKYNLEKVLRSVNFYIDRVHGKTKREIFMELLHFCDHLEQKKLLERITVKLKK